MTKKQKINLTQAKIKKILIKKIINNNKNRKEIKNILISYLNNTV